MEPSPGSSRGDPFLCQPEHPKGVPSRWHRPLPRGHGLGTLAQRWLVDYLFRTTLANRIEAITEEGNIPEQKALERLGSQCEGKMRGRVFRQGKWRDGYTYALLRADRS